MAKRRNTNSASTSRCDDDEDLPSDVIVFNLDGLLPADFVVSPSPEHQSFSVVGANAAPATTMTAEDDSSANPAQSPVEQAKLARKPGKKPDGVVTFKRGKKFMDGIPYNRWRAQV